MEARPKIDAYIKVRLEREQEIINAVASKSDGCWKSNVFEVVYGPRNLTEPLKIKALELIDLHLDKLIKDGTITVVNDEIPKYHIAK